MEILDKDRNQQGLDDMVLTTEGRRKSRAELKDRSTGLDRGLGFEMCESLGLDLWPLRVCPAVLTRGEFWASTHNQGMPRCFDDVEA